MTADQKPQPEFTLRWPDPSDKDTLPQGASEIGEITFSFEDDDQNAQGRPYKLNIFYECNKDLMFFHDVMAHASQYLRDNSTSEKYSFPNSLETTQEDKLQCSINFTDKNIRKSLISDLLNYCEYNGFCKDDITAARAELGITPPTYFQTQLRKYLELNSNVFIGIVDRERVNEEKKSLLAAKDLSSFQAIIYDKRGVAAGNISGNALWNSENIDKLLEAAKGWRNEPEIEQSALELIRDRKERVMRRLLNNTKNLGPSP